MIIIISYFLCIIYIKNKIKKNSTQILEELKLKIDKDNLDNLIKLSEKKQNPIKYNENIIEYQEYIAIYTGIRALKSPVETFRDFFILLENLIKKFNLKWKI